MSKPIVKPEEDRNKIISEALPIAIGIGKGMIGIEGTFVRYNKDEWREQRILNKKLESGIITRQEYRELNKDLEERVLRRGLSENSVVPESELNNAKNINAKYDAELAALQSTETKPQEVITDAKIDSVDKWDDLDSFANNVS